MAIRYYSDRTKQFYNTAEECEKAEFEAKEAENREKIRKEREIAYQKEQREKAIAERKEDAAKVEAARKAMVEAQSAYRKELEAFCKKHGSYHWTSRSIEDIPTLFSNFFDIFS